VKRDDDVVIVEKSKIEREGGSWSCCESRRVRATIVAGCRKGHNWGPGGCLCEVVGDRVNEVKSASSELHRPVR